MIIRLQSNELHQSVNYTVELTGFPTGPSNFCNKDTHTHPQKSSLIVNLTSLILAEAFVPTRSR